MSPSLYAADFQAILDAAQPQPNQARTSRLFHLLQTGATNGSTFLCDGSGPVFIHLIPRSARGGQARLVRRAPSPNIVGVDSHSSLQSDPQSVPRLSLQD